MPLVVHHLENSQSLRVVWLLEELQMPYEIKLYKRHPQTKLAPPELKQLSPLGTSPCITDDSLVLCETNAILDYLVDQAPSQQQQQTLRPSRSRTTTTSARSRADYLFFWHGSQGSLNPTVTTDVIWRVTLQQVPCFIKPIVQAVYDAVKKSVLEPRIDAFLQACERQLEKQQYIASSTNLTLADIALIFPLQTALENDPMLITKYPQCQAWLTRMQARPAYQAALEKVGEGNPKKEQARPEERK